MHLFFTDFLKPDEPKRNYLIKTQEKEVHRPGLEPEFRRWQRLVITSTLSMLAVVLTPVRVA